MAGFLVRLTCVFLGALCVWRPCLAHEDETSLPDPPRPHSGETGVNLGLLFKAQYARESGDLAQALTFAETAYRNQPGSPDIAHFFLSLRIENVEENAFSSQTERADVLVALKDALLRFPDDYRFPLLIGSLLIDDTRWSQFAAVEDPEAHLKRALSLLGEDAAHRETLIETHFNLGRFYWSRRRYMDAAEAFEWVCEQDPENTWGFYYAGQSFENINRIRTALRYYRQFQKLRLDEVWPGKPPVDLNVSIIQAMLEPSETALQDLAMLGSNRRMLLRVAVRFLRVGRYHLSLQLLAFLPASDWNLEYYTYLLHAHMQLGDYEFVFETCRDRLAKTNDTEMRELFFKNLLESGFLSGRYREVIALYDAYPDLAESQRDTLLPAALAELLVSDREPLLLARLQAPDLSNAYLEQLVKDYQCYGREVAGLKGLLDLSIARDDFLGAMQHLCRRYAPFDAALLPEPLQENMAFVAISLGYAEEGFAIYEALLASAPEDASLNNNYGYYLADVGVALDKAERHILRALASAPQNAAYLDSLAWLQYRQGKYEEAKATLERALAIEPNDPEKLAHLGDVLSALGEYREAKNCWSQAMDLKGGLYFPLLNKLDP